MKDKSNSTAIKLYGRKHGYIELFRSFWSSGSGFGFNYKNVCILYSKYHIYKRLTETNAFRTIGTIETIETIELNFL